MISRPDGVGVMSPGPKTMPGQTMRTSRPQSAKHCAITRLWYLARLYGKSTSQASYGVVFTSLETAQGLTDADGMVNDLVLTLGDGVDPNAAAADLAASLGHLGHSGHPQVQQAIDRVAAVAKAQGKAAGIFAASAAEARDYAARGFTLVALAADVVWLLAGARQALATARG